MEYDIFISYRRDGGYDTAQLLYDRLTQMRYRVSFDLETLRGGKFNTQLYQRIEQCSDVLVIMSKDSLNPRENPDDDWFRLEIAHALKHKKNIVPVFLRDFKFPQKGELPPDIADLVDYQGVTASQEHFDSVLQRICRNFKAKPQRRKWPMVAAIATVILAAAGVGIGLNVDRIFPYPFSQEQKKQVEMLSANMMLVGEAYSEFMSAENELHDAAERSMLAGDKGAFDDAASLFSHRLKKARDQYAAALAAATDFTHRVDRMPIDYAGMRMFLVGLDQELRLADDVVPGLERVCDPSSPCEKDDRLRVLNCKRQMHNTRADIFSVSVMGIFCKISPDALADFKKIAIRWTQFGLLSEPWLRDEKEIARKGEALCNKLETAIGELRTIVGTQNTALAVDLQKFRKKMAEADMTHDQSEALISANKTLANIKTLMETTKTMPERELALYKRQLMDMGATAEQADAQVAKLRKMAELKQRIANTQESLGEIKERARARFAPKDDDDVGMLWGKALRFRMMNMLEDVKHCIEVLRKRNTSEFPLAALDVAEAVFFSKDELPFNGGVLVCSYEPPATNHAIYKIGDVITEVNGKPCMRYEDYRGKAGNTYTVYRRDVKGRFEKLTKVMPENQPRVALVNLIEESQQ